MQMSNKVKIKYSRDIHPTFMIFFGIGVACLCIPCFAKAEDAATYVIGVVLLLIGVCCLVIPGVIMKIKDDFKERKRFMKNSRYAIKAVVTEVREKGGTLICKSEQTGLEYEADHVFNDLSEYKGAEVWVYLDPDDPSEYGRHFVDLEGMVL